MKRLVVKRLVAPKARLVLILAPMLILAACRPHNVLSPKQMREVLYDLHRADAVIQVAGYQYGHDVEIGKYYYVVLEQHGITQAQFDSSLVWYTDHPQRFNKIYAPICHRCEQEVAEWDEAHPSVSSHSMTRKPLRTLPPMEEVQQRLWHGVGDSVMVPRMMPIEVEIPMELPFKMPIDSTKS